MSEMNKTIVNTETEIQDVNEINLTGRIASIYRVNRKMLLMTISTRTVSRLYRKGVPASEVYDFPTVYWYGKNSDEIEKQYKVGDIVTIEAYARLAHASNKQKENKWYQDIVGKTIETTMKQIDEGFGLQTNIGQYCSDENEVRLSGMIKYRFEPNDKVTILTIESCNGTHKDRVNVSLTGKNRLAVTKIHDGSHICLMGKVQTHTNDKDGKKKTTQKIVCYNIAEA